MAYHTLDTYGPADYHVDPRALPNLDRIAQTLIRAKCLSESKVMRASAIAQATDLHQSQISRLLKRRVGFTKVESMRGTLGYYYWPEFRVQAAHEGNPGYPRNLQTLLETQRPAVVMFTPNLGGVDERMEIGAPKGVTTLPEAAPKWEALPEVPEKALETLWNKGEIAFKLSTDLPDVIRQLITLSEWAERKGLYNGAEQSDGA